MVCSHRSVIEQAAKQRIARVSNRVKRAGTIECVGETPLLGRTCAASPNLDLQRIAAVARGQDSAGRNLQTTLGDHPHDRIRHLWRNSVTMHVPPWPGVPQEAALLLKVEALPQSMTVGPQAVDGSAPSDLCAAATEPAPESAQTAAWNVVLLDRRGLEVCMAAGDQATSRQGQDLSLITGCVERKHEVDHGEAGTDEKYRLAALRNLKNCSLGLLSPRIANEPPIRAGEHAKPFRFLIADREDKSLRSDILAVVELNVPTAIIPRSAGGGRCDRAHVAAADSVVEDLAKVACEHSSLREPSTLAPFAFDPSCEVIRLASPGTHAFRPNVEEVRGLGGRISNAFPHPTASVDQDGADATTRQLRRHDRPRRAAADDCNRNDPIRFRSQAKPPGSMHPLSCGSYDRASARRSSRRSA